MATWIEELNERLAQVQPEDYIAPEIDSRVRVIVESAEVIGEANDFLRRLFTVMQLQAQLYEGYVAQHARGQVLESQKVMMYRIVSEQPALDAIFWNTLHHDFNVWTSQLFVDGAWKVHKLNAEEQRKVSQAVDDDAAGEIFVSPNLH